MGHSIRINTAIIVICGTVVLRQGEMGGGLCQQAVIKAIARFLLFLTTTRPPPPNVLFLQTIIIAVVVN